MMNSIRVRNPRTGQLDYQFEKLSNDELSSKCTALRSAQHDWWLQGTAKRIEVLRQFADVIGKHKNEIFDALCRDTGRWGLSEMEIDALQVYTEERCVQALEVMKAVKGRSASGKISFQQQYIPYSLVVVISPWNYPFILSFLDAIPALLAGCAVIIKPSEVTPRFIEPTRLAIAEVPGLAEIMEIVPGDGETGQELIKQSDAVVFTGSVVTGKKVALVAAEGFKPAFLELGGKDPAIVLASANIENAAHAIMRGGIVNTGQACFATERIYGEKGICKELTDKLCNLAAQIELNYPDIEKGHIGPLIFDKQAEIIRSHLDDAIAKGAKVLCGGEIEEHGGGYWIRPTVLVNVDHSMQIMQDETFGPILPVMDFETESEVIELANDTIYGLSAAVFGDENDVVRVGRQLEAGGIYMNDIDLMGAVGMYAEKVAFKCSGMGGTRYGPGGIFRYLRQQALILQHDVPERIDALAGN